MRLLWPLIGLSALVCAGALAGVVVHVRRDVVPPGCTDPRTLEQVMLRLPPQAKLERIKVIAGGPLAFRFVCEADMGASTVHYTSQFTPDHSRQLVTVSVTPVLIWMRVQ